MGQRARTAERVLSLPGERVLCRCSGLCSQLRHSAHGCTRGLACTSAGHGSLSLGPALGAHWPRPEVVLNKFSWHRYSIFKIL